MRLLNLSVDVDSNGLLVTTRIHKPSTVSWSSLLGLAQGFTKGEAPKLGVKTKVDTPSSVVDSVWSAATRIVQDFVDGGSS